MFLEPGIDIDMRSVASCTTSPNTLAWIKTQDFSMRDESAESDPVTVGCLLEDVTGTVGYR